VIVHIKNPTLYNPRSTKHQKCRSYCTVQGHRKRVKLKMRSQKSNHYAVAKIITQHWHKIELRANRIQNPATHHSQPGRTIKQQSTVPIFSLSQLIIWIT